MTNDTQLQVYHAAFQTVSVIELLKFLLQESVLHVLRDTYQVFCLSPLLFTFTSRTFLRLFRCTFLIKEQQNVCVRTGYVRSQNPSKTTLHPRNCFCVLSTTWILASSKSHVLCSVPPPKRTFFFRMCTVTTSCTCNNRPARQFDHYLLCRAITSSAKHHCYVVQTPSKLALSQTSDPGRHPVKSNNNLLSWSSNKEQLWIDALTMAQT
jgi:hypothetical protein